MPIPFSRVRARPIHPTGFIASGNGTVAVHQLSKIAKDGRVRCLRGYANNDRRTRDAMPWRWTETASWVRQDDIFPTQHLARIALKARQATHETRN